MNYKFKEIIYTIHRYFLVWWHNFRWKKVRETFINDPHYIADNDKIKDGEDINTYAVRASYKLMNEFIYKPDDASELGDSMPPPPYLYKLYKESQMSQNHDSFTDDCDGFHGALYHMLAQANANVSIVSVISLKNKYGHAVCGYYDYQNDHKYHIQDYVTNYANQDLDYLLADAYSEITDGAFIIFKTQYDYDNLVWRNVPIEKHVYTEEDIEQILARPQY